MQCLYCKIHTHNSFSPCHSVVMGNALVNGTEPTMEEIEEFNKDTIRQIPIMRRQIAQEGPMRITVNDIGVIQMAFTALQQPLVESAPGEYTVHGLTLSLAPPGDQVVLVMRNDAFPAFVSGAFVAVVLGQLRDIETRVRLEALGYASNRIFVLHSDYSILALLWCCQLRHSTLQIYQRSHITPPPNMNVDT